MFETKAIILIVIGIILGIMMAIFIKNSSIKTLLNVISIIVFVLISIIVVQKIVYKDNKVLIYNLYQISSDSMANTLKTNDYFLIRKTNNYKVGDIVTFKREDRLVTHRIIRIDGDKIITKGDSNFKEDESITIDRIVGKVIFYGDLLNITILYLKYLIISFVTIFLVTQLFINNNQKKRFS